MTLSFISVDRLLVIWLNTRYTRRLQRMIAVTAIVLSAVLMMVDSVVDYKFELQEKQDHDYLGIYNSVYAALISSALCFSSLSLPY